MVEGVDDGWEVAYAVSIMPLKKIYTKIRLNKTLSILQCEGFPIDNRFINAEKGPYDPHIDVLATKAEESGYILIEKSTNGPDDDWSRDDYTITEKGEQLVKMSVHPQLSGVWSKGMRFGLSRAIITVTSQGYLQLSKMIHKDLHLDEPREYLEYLFGAEEYFTTLVSKPNPYKYCPREIEKYGAASQSLKLIERIKKGYLPPKNRETGKNHILFNIERLEKITSIPLVVTPPIECQECGKCAGNVRSQCKHTREFIKHYLRCMEYNASVYKIMTQIIDPEKYQFPELIGGK